MEFPRASGILLHPTSLPGRFGIGDLGEAAYRFIDFLADAGQQFWQIMPLGPTGFGDSPYSALSAFAGNPLLIDLEQLVGECCLAWWDLDGLPQFPEDHVDFDGVPAYKRRLLELAFTNFQQSADDNLRSDFARFVALHDAWLPDFALYLALKEAHEGADWGQWEPEIAQRKPAALAAAREQYSHAVAYHEYVQFQFFRQWGKLRAYANERGIRIIGDIPIFIAYDSADAWAHPEQFFFDEAGHPTQVAGVPPDFFSETGQRWGNPLYRWNVMARNGYEWWIERFRMLLDLVDVVRLDHFRGFVAYWSVPAEEETAENGEWVEGPGLNLFRTLEQALGPVPLIAEDLGLITPEVEALRDALAAPGMKVLQFAFADPDSTYLPHNYDTHNCVVYTGTHDNDTTAGWFQKLDARERTFVQKYLGRHGDDISWDLMRLAMMSIADLTIFPLQDVLKLDSSARMNVPGQAEGNWGWRFARPMLAPDVAARLRDLTETYRRGPKPPVEPEVMGEERAEGEGASTSRMA